MMRIERPRHAFALLIEPRRFGVLASLTASLFLGACSQSPELLQSLALTSDKTDTADESPAVPQTELQKATIYWGKEYAKKPTELQTALNYARDLKALGEKRKAMSILQQASMIHTNNSELEGEYGRLALDLNQVNVANQLLAAADDPTRPDWRVISARGTVMAKQGKYSDAIPFYERALTLAPKNPGVMNNLAMAHAMMGDPKKAEEILRQAVAAPDATPKMRENLALVLGLQGRYDESRSVASSVLNADVASANTSYLKQMVKLDPKTDMPDAKSFLSQTSVAQAAPAQQDQNANFATAVIPSSDAPNVWQTSSIESSAALPAAFKGTAH